MPRKTKAGATATTVGDEYKAPTSPDEPATAPPAAGMAGSPMEIVFSFDTTGSMYSLLDEVRKNVSELIRRLQDDIPNIRIGVIAHGDYCDEDTYVVKMIDFTRDTDTLVNFVNHVGPTGGGDSDECYELALKTARTQFSWTLGTQRSLVVIGDANPHGTSYHYYKDHTTIDWKKEADALFAMGVHVYGVSCSRSDHAFYEDIAKRTDGTLLELKEFKNIFDMICAICYKEQGADHFYAFEQEVRDREKRMLNSNMDLMLKTLRKSASTASTMSLKESDPATPKTTTLKRVAPVPTATVAPTPVKKARVAPTKVSRPKTVKFLAKPKVKRVVRKPALKKARKPTTAVSKAVKKRTAKVSAEPVKKPRETAKLSDVTVKGASWSSWFPLIAPKESLQLDLPRVLGPGFRNTCAFCSDNDKLAIYEVAVSTPGSNRKHVVYVRRFTHKRGLLDTALFSYMKYKDSQIDYLINQKCTLYVRRAVVPGTSGELDLREQFDYAWCKNGYGRTRKRALTKNGVMISDSKY